MPSIYVSGRYLASLSESERSALRVAAQRCSPALVGGIVGFEVAGNELPGGWPVVSEIPEPVASKTLVLLGSDSEREDVVSLQVGFGASKRNCAFARSTEASLSVFGLDPNGGMANAIDMIDGETVVNKLMKRFQSQFDSLDRLKRAYVFGARRLGRTVGEGLRARGCAVSSFLDNNKSVWGDEVDGSSVSGVVSSLDRSTPVIIATTRFPYSIARQLQTAGFQTVIPYPAMTLLDPEHFPPEIPYISIYADIPENRGLYLAEYINYVDDRSRQVLDRILQYRLTLDASYIQDINDCESGQYFDPELMPLSDAEVFVDAGGFDGTTSKTFVQRAGGSYDHIYYFEPDEALMQRSRQVLNGLSEITYCQAGAYSYSGVARFCTTGTTNGSVSADSQAGDIEIKVRRIDDVVDRPPTIIKMDIEGAEPEALSGAAETIRRHAPRLAIAAYHRGPDLWQLAGLIRSLNPSYEIGLRHYTESGLETVLYAIPPRSR